MADVEMLPDADAIRRVMRTGGVSGTCGYVNRRSGWADARAAMVWVRGKCEVRSNIRFIHGEVQTLRIVDTVSDNARVDGVVLANGEVLTADLTILAAGAWTPMLQPGLAGAAMATAQVMAYVPVSPAEEAALADIPVTLNLSTGVFVFPARNGEVKVARHAYGYVNKVQTTVGAGGDEGVVSRPVTGCGIPKTDEEVLKTALAEMVPAVGGRAFSRTRLCWYTDTATGDFIVCYHPTIANLFLATGGSGHAFKFLPILGEKIADAVTGRLEESLAPKWRFPETIGSDGGGNGDAYCGMVVTRDGSRSGDVGVELGTVMQLP
ncbi:hypothetical protein TWF696_009182 [Orbilia brochopaga]